MEKGRETTGNDTKKSTFCYCPGNSKGESVVFGGEAEFQNFPLGSQQRFNSDFSLCIVSAMPLPQVISGAYVTDSVSHD